MISKDDLLEAIADECRICKHLATKVPEGSLDYRPTAGQRSTLELMPYLSFCGIGATRSMTEGSWDGYKAVEARSASMQAEEFDAAMDRQVEEITAVFAGLSDSDMQEKKAKLPTGQEVKLGAALVHTTLRWMTAYRMQLFLHAKQSGNSEIGTMNNWYGIEG